MTGRSGSTAAVLVAAGRGMRAGGGVPKQYRLLAGRPMMAHAASALVAHHRVGPVVVVVAPGEEERAARALGGLAERVALVPGGPTRQDSVRLGLEHLAQDPPRFVLIHDAARPILPSAMISRVIDAMGECEGEGACPALPVADSLRTGDGLVTGEVAREGLWRVQTPQGFPYGPILAAHRNAPPGASDDVAVARATGMTVRLVDGDERAMKVTSEQDFAIAEALFGMADVTGYGFDVHRLGAGDHLWLGGVRIPHDQGLVGHSDADVALHALTDAVLGAIGAGDIGVHFPPSDPQWRGAASDRFLAHAARLVADGGGRILHADLTIVCEAPRIGPHRAAMIERLSAILADHRPRLSVKGTTTEQLGFTGRGEGIAAHAVATVRLPLSEREPSNAA